MNFDMRLVECEIAGKPKQVNGRPHGLSWHPRYELTFSFKTPQERSKFIALLEEVLRAAPTEKKKTPEGLAPPPGVV